MGSYKILLISDDAEKKLFNNFKNAITSGSDTKLFYSSSNFDDLKNNMRRDFYIIFIDYDDLTTDIDGLVDLIRTYLYSLPLIVVISEDESIFDRTKMPNVSFLSKSVGPEIVSKQLENSIRIMEYNRSINDISHLPGNMVINDIMNIKLKNHENFSIVYIDIDKFKSFTDYYGLYRAGKVIQFLTNLILELVDEYGSLKDFIGHVGGDDFVVIFNDYETAKMFSERLIDRFDEKVADYYDEIDVEREYIEVLNRKGVPEKFPLITVSLINVSDKSGKYESTNDIYQEMMRLKKEAKQTMGSILLQS